MDWRNAGLACSPLDRLKRGVPDKSGAGLKNVNFVDAATLVLRAASHNPWYVAWPPIGAFIFMLFAGVPDRQLPFHIAATCAGAVTFTVAFVLSNPNSSIVLSKRTGDHGPTDALIWPWCAWIVGIVQMMPAFAILYPISSILDVSFSENERRNAYLGAATLLSVPIGLAGVLLLTRKKIDCAVQRYVLEFPATEHTPTPEELDKEQTTRLLQDYEAGVRIPLQAGH